MADQETNDEWALKEVQAQLRRNQVLEAQIDQLSEQVHLLKEERTASAGPALLTMLAEIKEQLVAQEQSFAARLAGLEWRVGAQAGALEQRLADLLERMDSRHERQTEGLTTRLAKQRESFDARLGRQSEAMERRLTAMGERLFARAAALESKFLALDAYKTATDAPVLTELLLQRRDFEAAPDVGVSGDLQSLLPRIGVFVASPEDGHHGLQWDFPEAPAGAEGKIAFLFKAQGLSFLNVRGRFSRERDQAVRLEIDVARGAAKLATESEALKVQDMSCVAVGEWTLLKASLEFVRASRWELILSAMNPERKGDWRFGGRGEEIWLAGAGYQLIAPRDLARSVADPDAPQEVVEAFESDAMSADAPDGAGGVAVFDSGDGLETSSDAPSLPSSMPVIYRGKPISDKKWAELSAQREEHERVFRESGMLERVEALRGIHQGKRAFLIGNGPSIKFQDLTRLRDEITFVSNWFVHHDKFAEINPKYYCVSSHEMFGGWNKTPELNPDFAALLKQKQTPDQRFFFSSKFVPHVIETGVAREENAWGLIFDRPKLQVDEIGAQNYDLSRCMDDAYTALLTFCVPLCAHFGVSELYLVGCDCDYKLKAPDDPKAYFYSFDKHKTSTTSYDSLQRIWSAGGPIFKTYEIVQREAAARGVAMFNATRGGRLEQLPRVSYEDLVS